MKKLLFALCLLTVGTFANAVTCQTFATGDLNYITKLNLIANGCAAPSPGAGAFTSLVLSGTAGAGYIELANQSVAPGTPSSAARFYVDSSNRFSWKGTNGYARTFDGTANTASRIYVLPDAAGTIILDSATQALTNKTITASGLITASVGVQINGGSFAAGRIYKDAVFGTSVAATTGSSYDFTLFEPSGVHAIMRVPTGTNDVIFNGAISGTNQDATGGYVGLTLYKINFKNAANTFTSFFTNANTAARTYTFQDRNGTVADDTDLATKAALAGNASQAFSTSTATQGSNTTTAASTAFVITEFGKHKNRAINGLGLVQQRTAPTITAALQYGAADRHLIGVTGGTSLSGTVGVRANTGCISGTSYGAIAASWTTGSWIFKHRISANNSVGLDSTSITISGKLYQDTGGSRSFTVSVGRPTTTADTFSAVTNIGTSGALPIATATTTAFLYTQALNSTDADKGLEILITDNATNTVSSKNYTICDLQVEEGLVQTETENRPYETEIALCLPYYRPVGKGAMGAAFSATQVALGAVFSPPMRAVPTFAMLSTTPVIGDVGFGVFTGTASAVAGYNNADTRYGWVHIVNGFTGMTTGHTSFMDGDYMSASSEL